MDWQDLRAPYLAVLAQAGYRPEIDSDGDIRFAYEGRHFYVTRNCDATYLEILYPGFWSIDSGPELGMVLFAASTANRTTKAAKLWVSEDLDRVSAVAECLISGPLDLQPIFMRLLRCLSLALETFRAEMLTQTSDNSELAKTSANPGRSMMTSQPCDGGDGDCAHRYLKVTAAEARCEKCGARTTIATHSLKAGPGGVQLCTECYSWFGLAIS